jgi:hypothetical protein
VKDLIELHVGYALDYVRLMMDQDRYDEKDFVKCLKDVLERLLEAGHGDAMLTRNQTVKMELASVTDLLEESP